MWPEIGLFCLTFALPIALLQGIFPLFWPKQIALQRFSRVASISLSSCILMSFLILMHAFAVNDFSVAYVANNSNAQLPLIYRLCATWGAHEGSILLWLAILACWMLFLTFARIENILKTRVLAVMALISAGFLFFILWTSNPFVRLSPVPANGLDLNPLLQDPGFIIHPPMLYMGYVGFSVSFAFAIAGLLEGNLSREWAQSLRYWVLLAWCFLTLGVTLGSWWAYRVLGWGGWWFWDPVENVAFMPWLVGTALMHAIFTTRRQLFKNWSVWLAIFAFALSLIGTFLVRSGLLTSVHAFASDPERGLFLLKFIAVIVGASLLLFALKSPPVTENVYLSLYSRETVILIASVLLFVMMLAILLGTLYPIILSALNLNQISVGAPYFNKVFIPLFLPCVLLMIIAPFFKWQTNDAVKVRAALVRWVLLPIFTLFVLLIVWQHLSIAVAIAILLAIWLILSILVLILQRRIRHFGMLLAHFSLAISMIGIILTSQLSVKRDVAMKVGSAVTLQDVTFHLTSLQPQREANYTALVANFAVTTKQDAFQIQSEKRFFQVSNQAMSAPGIHIAWWRDIYVTLGNRIDDNTFAVRIYIKPFVRWIWIGGIGMLLGGILSFYRALKKG